MKNLIRICILIIVAAVYSCDDPYKDETFAVYDMQPISSYLSTRPDDFSEWIKVMKYADMYNAVNQATAKLTLFAPTNQAMEAFYQEKKVSSVEELGKVYVRQLVQYHLVNDTITLEEFSKGGELEDKTLSNDILEVTFNADDSSEGGFNAMYMNGEAHVKELAIHTSNGFVYVLDDVMRPMVESVYQKALMIELKEKGIHADTEMPINVYYKNEIVGEFRADIIVKGEIIIELKAVQHLLPIHETQLVNYLTATNIDHGLLINFGGERIEIKRKFREYKHL